MARRTPLRLPPGRRQVKRNQDAFLRHPGVSPARAVHPQEPGRPCGSCRKARWFCTHGFHYNRTSRPCHTWRGTLNSYLPQGERGANGERHYTALVPASATVWRCPGLPHARRASSEPGAGSAGDSRIRRLPLFSQQARPINAWQCGAREVCSNQSRTILMHQAGRASRTWRGTLPP
jgi:hypothetical protein